MGYGTGATLKASSDAYNAGIKQNELLARSEQERELAAARDTRAEAQEGREQERFGMQRELYERQTRLLNDQEAREKMQRELNRGMATLKATGGQVYQPLIDTYNNLMPDGGRINGVVRNPDGTFDVEYDLKGQRMSLKGQTTEDFGSFFMSMSDPEGFLNMHREIDATKAERAAAERLERLKAELKNKPSPTQYANAYDTFSEIYDKAYTAGDALTGVPGEPLPGAPAREEWVRAKMIEAGFVAGGGGGEPGAIPPPGEPNPEREKALGFVAEAFSSREKWRETMRAAGLPVEDLMNSVSGGAMLNEVETAFVDGGEALDKHIRAAAARLGVADITDEELMAIKGGRQVTPHAPGGGGAPGALQATIDGVTDLVQGVPSLAQLGYQGIQAMAGAGPAITPSQDATGRLGPPAEAQIIASNEQVIPPQALPPQGVVPPQQQPGVTQVTPRGYYQRAYGR